MNILDQSKLFARMKTGTRGTSQEGFAEHPKQRLVPGQEMAVRMERRS